MQQNQSDISPDVLQQATSVVTQSRIVILIKGTPQAPKCGFSKRMLHLLVNNGIQLTYFNVMDVKEKPIYNAFKQIAGLPTFPQMYINGVIVGGLDITTELFEEGELQKQLLSEANDFYTPDAIVENKIQLNIRIPDGKIMQGLFTKESLLSDVYKYVIDNRDHTFYGADHNNNSKKQFMLVRPFPYEPLDRSSLESTLEQLGLGPKSPLLVVIPEGEEASKDCETPCTYNNTQNSYISYATMALGVSAFCLLLTRKFLASKV